MRCAALAICLVVAACSVEQPESIKTVAAFEVPLLTESERTEFLTALQPLAHAYGMHVDADTQEELDQRASAIPEAKMTIHAAVWRDADDKESVATIMDFHDHLGKVWIMFAKGTNEQLNRGFRDHAMQEIRRRWPATLSLPIMPSGAIPIYADLLLTPNGYIVKPSEAYKYAKPRSE